MQSLVYTLSSKDYVTHPQWDRIDKRYWCLHTCCNTIGSWRTMEPAIDRQPRLCWSEHFRNLQMKMVPFHRAASNIYCISQLHQVELNNIFSTTGNIYLMKGHIVHFKKHEVVECWEYTIHNCTGLATFCIQRSTKNE